MTPLNHMREHRYHLPLHCPLSSTRSTGHRYQGAHRLDHRAADTEPPALQRRVRGQVPRPHRWSANTTSPPRLRPGPARFRCPQPTARLDNPIGSVPLSGGPVLPLGRYPRETTSAGMYVVHLPIFVVNALALVGLVIRSALVAAGLKLRAVALVSVPFTDGGSGEPGTTSKNT